MKEKIGLGTVLSIIAVALNVYAWWLIKSPFCINSSTTWLERFVLFLCLGIIWMYCSDSSSRISLTISILSFGVSIVLIVVLLLGLFISSNIFTSKERYQLVSEMVEIIEETDEGSPFPNLLGSNNDTSNLPLIGLPEAIKNSETQMGKQPALGSQFELLEAEVTSQSINNSLNYVVPLEPKEFWKWDGNNHGYFIIDRNNGKTTFEETGLSITEHAPFGSNAKRVIYKYMRRNGISGRITELSPEIDDEGNFKYVATVYKTKGIEGFKTVTGVVELDAVSGSCQYYGLDEIPEYVDRVFPEEFFFDYIKYYGKYKRGWFNSWTSQKEVLEPTSGSDIVYIDGTCWYYTGYTSAGKGESSNGIMMMNCRTGEIKYYITYGISESKAMGVAEGRVQEKGYKASYPLLLMIGGQESYFMLMRDESNNLCGYAFVNYKDYSKAAVADTLALAQEQYIKNCGINTNADILDNLDLSNGKAAITDIGSEVKDGETIWYIKMNGNEHIFAFSSDLEPEIVFAEVGDIVKVTYVEAETKVVSAITIEMQ